MHVSSAIALTPSRGVDANLEKAREREREPPASTEPPTPERNRSQRAGDHQRGRHDRHMKRLRSVPPHCASTRMQKAADRQERPRTRRLSLQMGPQHSQSHQTSKAKAAVRITRVIIVGRSPEREGPNVPKMGQCYIFGICWALYSTWWRLMDQNVPVTIVMPVKMKRACERRAAAERRPLSAYLRNVIEDAVSDHGREHAGKEANHGPAVA
jgi:hypothetical protein